MKTIVELEFLENNKKIPMTQIPDYIYPFPKDEVINCYECGKIDSEDVYFLEHKDGSLKCSEHAAGEKSLVKIHVNTELHEYSLN